MHACVRVRLLLTNELFGFASEISAFALCILGVFYSVEGRGEGGVGVEGRRERRARVVGVGIGGVRSFAHRARASSRDERVDK